MPDWLGMFFGPAEAIPNHGFQHLQNAIYDGSSVSARPGAQQAFDSVTGPINGFCDAGDIGAAIDANSDGGGGSGGDTSDRYLYFTGIHTNGANRTLFRYDTVLGTLEEQTIGPLDPSPYHELRGLERGSDGELYIPGGLIGGGVVQAEVLKVVPVPGSQPTVTTVFALTGTATEPGFGADGPTTGLDASVLPFRGWGLTGEMIEDPAVALKFFAAREYRPLIAARDGKVYRDGVLDDTPSFVFTPAGDVKCAAYMGFLNGTVYAGWGEISARAMMDTIRKRISANNWTNLTMPTAPYGHFAAVGNPVNIFGKLYVSGFYRSSLPAPADFLSHYLSIDASDVVTIEHQVPIGVQSNNVPINNAAFNGKLYYLISDQAFNFNVLGMFDGTTWTDVHWDGMISGVKHRMMGIRIAKGQLWSIAHTGTVLGGDVRFWLIHSNGTDTTSWAQALQLSITANPLVDLVGRDT